MTVQGADPRPGQVPETSPRRHRGWWVLGAVAVVAALLVAGLVVALGGRVLHPHGRPAVPSFPSLSAQPDASLHGTVAYFARASGCVRLAAASGQSARDLLCIPAQDLAVKPEQGIKPAGPQLVWLPGDKLEVTMFWWRPAPGPLVYEPSWQKVVDVRSGAVVDVPATQVPSTPSDVTPPTVNARGERVAYTFDAASGRVEVTLTDSAGSTRTVLSARGPGEYTYRFGPVFWAPNGDWIAASDADRILVITPGTRPLTRVLVTDAGGGAGGGTAGPSFAITASDLLGTAK